MATVWIPSLLRDMTGGLAEIQVSGKTVREVIDALDEMYPGLRDRLVDVDAIRPNIALVVDGLRSRKGLREPVTANSEVHFVPAISGGQMNTGQRQLCQTL
ncbi:MAG TPA: MoaD/ThiS family protein [Anaerolineae bacterium]|jgi:molybdopterin synthase sulfur carrier subunit